MFLLIYCGHINLNYSIYKINIFLLEQRILGSSHLQHLQRHLRFTVYILPWLLLERHFGIISIQLKHNSHRRIRMLGYTRQIHYYTLNHWGALTVLNKSEFSYWRYWEDKKPPTHFISSSVKRRPVINMRRGMVMMSMKGRARDTGLDFTIQRSARHTIWMAVNRCIRPVLTCVHDVQTWITQTKLQTWMCFSCLT